MMKLLIELLPTQENVDFLRNDFDEYDLGDLKGSKYINEDNLEIMIRGDFFIDFYKGGLWIEDSDYVYLRVDITRIKRFVMKGIE